MTTPPTHHIEFTKAQCNNYLIPAFLVGCFELVCLYGLSHSFGVNEQFWVLSGCVSAILIPVTIYLIAIYRWISDLHISMNDEWISYSSRKKIETFKIDEIISIQDKSWWGIIKVKTKECNIYIPKHKILFDPFYDYLQERLMAVWDNHHGKRKLTLKSSQKEWISLSLSIILFSGLIFPILELSFTATMSYTICFLYFLIICIQLSVNHAYECEESGIWIKSTLKSTFVEYEQIRKVSLQSNFPSDDLVIKLKDGKKYRLPEYNYPIEVVATYLDNQLKRLRNPQKSHL